ncbi:hypothetical protein G4B88_019134 [Cannabis sativa]|uniref:Ubiquitin-like protease family profile domain-containing protein n=1 Tax=Cannabis sativa TaxID=3483 RepID=A0A7J6HM42_CANSA|nr:hypothetical protein G4B88_019134 [Cannabis sativa]
MKIAEQLLDRVGRPTRNANPDSLRPSIALTTSERLKLPTKIGKLHHIGLSVLEIDKDQVVFVGLEAIAKIKVPHSLPDEEVEKTNANVSKEEEDDALPCTPLVDKRKRALTLKSLFVDFGLSNLKTTPMELMSSGSQSAGNEQDFKIVTNVNGLYALDDSLFVPVSPELEAKKEIHWVFGSLDLNEGLIFLSNSLRTTEMNAAGRNTMKAYFIVLPLLFDLLGFWKNRSNVLDLGSNLKASLIVVEIASLLIQRKNDCGAFVAAFAEFFINSKDIPNDFDIKVYRTRLAALLFANGQRKMTKI